MRRAPVWLALLGLLGALPASASIIGALELRGFTARPIAIDRSVSLHVNDISDRIIDDFTVLDPGSGGGVSLSSGVLNRVSGGGLDLVAGRLVLGGSVSAVSVHLDTSSGFGRRALVWVSGSPATSAPIPEPSSALLFAVGTGLVVTWLRRLRA